MKILASIIVGTNRPQNIEDFVKNIEQKSTFPEQVEIIFSVDTGDDKCINILKNLQTSSKVKIKYLEGVRKRGYFEANIHYNECLHLADPDSYFFAVFSDKLKIKTEGWDEKLKKYVHYFDDDFFRVRISVFKNLRYNLNFYEALMRPDNFAFHSRKFLEISGGWGDTWGPDTWVQGIVFFCELLGINDRDIVASDIDLENYQYSDIRSTNKASFVMINMGLWSFDFLSKSPQSIYNFLRLALKVKLYLQNYRSFKSNNSCNFSYQDEEIILRNKLGEVIGKTKIDKKEYPFIDQFILPKKEYCNITANLAKKEQLKKRKRKLKETKNKLKKLTLTTNLLLAKIKFFLYIQTEKLVVLTKNLIQNYSLWDLDGYKKIATSYQNIIKIQSSSNQFSIERNRIIEKIIDQKYNQVLTEAENKFPPKLMEIINKIFTDKQIPLLIDNNFVINLLRQYLKNDELLSKFYSEVAWYLMHCGLQDEAANLYKLALEKRYDDKDAIIYLQNLMYTSPDNYSEKRIYQTIKDMMSKINSNSKVIKSEGYENIITDNRILNIGYICHFFDNETSSNLLLPILKEHNREKVKIFVYSDQDPKITKESTRRLADVWHDVVAFNDQELYDLIQKDQIDILIELNGFTIDNRYKVVNLKPAPIQVSFYNLSATSGVEGIDYVISTEDIKLDQNYYSEKIINKEGVYLTISPNIPKISNIPSFVKNGYITFGSFGQIHKVSKEQIFLWADILKRVPNSKLYLKSSHLHREEILLVFRRYFEICGIDPWNRIIFEKYTDYNHLIKCYEKIDIALDTFPYAGGTTTSEALLCGVPVIHLTGERFCSQHGTNYLRYCNAPELICSNPEEFIAKAVELANNEDKIKWYRKNLPTSVRASKKCDIPNYTKELEDVYFKMWNNYIQKNHGK